MNSRLFKVIMLVCASIILVGCSAQAAATPTVDPKVVYTQVAQTVAAQITNAAKLTPKATFTPLPSFTPMPSLTPKATNATVTALTTTVLPGTAVATSATKVVVPTLPPTATVPGSLPPIPDKMEYVGQTIEDNSVFSPGQTFTMNWAIKNIGTTTWTSGYTVRLFGGERSGAPDEPVDRDVAPNTVYRVILDMKAPSKPGSYSTLWVITNPDGRNFGSFYLLYVVR